MGAPIEARRTAVSIPSRVSPAEDLTVVYAGTSKRREAFIKHVLPENATYWRVDGGDEEDIADVKSIMLAKIKTARRRINPKGNTAFIASDARTSVLTPGDFSSPTYLESLPKPNSVEGPKTVFDRMQLAAEQSEGVPYYTIFAASGIEYQGKKTATTETTTIQLDPNVIKHLATDEGYPVYLRAFEGFYSSPSYTKEIPHKVHVTDLSAGLSLPVLTSIGAVTAVDGARIEDKELFRKALRRGIHVAAVGIAPAIMNQVQPEAQQKYERWSWLDGVVEHSLNV